MAEPVLFARPGAVWRMPDKNELSDERLEGFFRSGDDQAFEILYERYKRPLLSYLTRLCGDLTEAQEFFQETFVRVFMSASPPAPGVFRVWLYKVATNVYRGALRRRAVRRHVALVDQPERVPAANSSNMPVGSAPTAQEIRSAVESLPRKYRTVIILSCFQGLRYAAIGEVEGCSVGTVKSRMFEARKMLRKKLSR